MACREIRFEDSMVKEFGEYLTDREVAPSTAEKYMRDVRTFRRYLGEEPVFTKERLIQYKEWLTEHYAVSSVNSMLVSLNQFLVSQELGRMKLKRIRIQKQFYEKGEKEMTRAEYEALILTARSMGKPQLGLIMETMCCTGIRISELKFFTVEGIKENRIKVWNKGKFRIVLMPGMLQKKLLAYAAKQGIEKGAVFVTKGGKAVNRSNVWRNMKSLSEEAGVKENKVFPHNLRHLFARTFYKVNKNLTDLADILGHSNLETTRIYTSSGISQWKRSIEKLDLLRT